MHTSLSLLVLATAASALPVLDNAVFLRPWPQARQLALDQVKKLSLNEKVGLMTGKGLFESRCTGNTSPAGDIPSLCYNDGPAGVRGTDKTTAYPVGINVAATFDRRLMYSRAKAMGKEARIKGINVLLAPDVNLVRSPRAGRMWETFGPDPFLSSVSAVETVNGIQANGVIACTKHLVGEEQEQGRLEYNVIIDDRTYHEAYFQPFLQVIRQADAACIMTSYNRLNGTYSSENAKLIGSASAIRKAGFKGFVLSDWGSTHSSAKNNIDAGLAVEQPGGDVLIGGGFYGDNLVTAVQDGDVSEAQVDALVIQILSSYYHLQQDQGFPATNFDSSLGGSIGVNSTNSTQSNQHVDARSVQNLEVARNVAIASHVLLKNAHDVLPLDQHRRQSIATIGSDASQGNLTCVDDQCDTGTIATGWGAGSTNLSFLISPALAFEHKARTTCQQTKLYLSLTDSLDHACRVARRADVSIVFVNADSGEQILQPADNNTAVGSGDVEGVANDRNNLTLWHHGEELIRTVAAASKKTIVVVHAPGPILVENWIDHVDAVIWAGMPGEQTGPALVDLIFGDEKLPFTVAKQECDYPATITTITPQQQTIHYSEGLLLDYRHFDRYQIAPRFEFGYGLSYTSFAYNNLVVKLRHAHQPRCDCSHDEPQDPMQILFDVEFCVENTGRATGKEVSQLYISHRSPSKSEPVRSLKGFESTLIKARQTQTITIPIRRQDLSVWDVEEQDWRYICESKVRRSVSPQTWHPEGCAVDIFVGSSSRSLHLQQTVYLS